MIENQVSVTTEDTLIKNQVTVSGKFCLSVDLDKTKSIIRSVLDFDRDITTDRQFDIIACINSVQNNPVDVIFNTDVFVNLSG